MHINGIRADAPLFNQTPPEVLERIIKLLGDASFHYADDSTSEWGSAASCKHKAADLCIQHRLDAQAIRHLVAAQPQLVSFDEFLTCILYKLYEASA